MFHIYTFQNTAYLFFEICIKEKINIVVQLNKTISIYNDYIPLLDVINC